MVQIFSNNAWVYSTETINQYDLNDSLISSNIYYFIYSSGILIDTTVNRTTYNRDTSASSLQIIQEHWNGSVWTNISTTIDTFDTDGRLIYQSFSNSLLYYNYRFYYLLNDSVDYYLYNEIQSSSANSDSVVNSYLPSGYLENRTTYRYQSINGWTPHWKISFTYDSLNNMLSYYNYLWIDPYWSCETEHVTLSYNSSNQVVLRTSGYCGIGGGSNTWYFYNTDGSPDSTFWSGWGSMGSQNYMFYTFDYLSLMNSIPEGDDYLLSVFPNPAIDKITISAPFRINSFFIFNFNGERVAAIESVNSKYISFQLPDLPSGIYLIQIQTENHKELFKKIIVE
jgi:hypothetical protein